MVKVLVTGGAGFIGSHVVDKLLGNDYEIIVVDNLITGKVENIDINKVAFYKSDINSNEFVEIVTKIKPDYIVHLAAQVSVAESLKDLMYDAEVNIKGSLNIIKVARENKVKKVIFASTAAVYGNPQELPITTEHIINPLSPYGLSKHTVENYLKLASELFGTEYVVLRFSNVYGPRQDAKGEGGVVAIFSERLTQNKEIIIYGDGEQLRDFIYVEDVANAISKSITHGKNLILNISTSKGTSINELFNLQKSLNGSSIIPIYEKARKGDIKYSILCNKDSLKSLNWEIEHSLEQGIEKTINFYNNKNLLQEK
jgi:UDP-glucose 4-epimerase